MINKNTGLFQEEIQRLNNKIPFLLVNPLNEASQKRKFLKQKTYNPQFKYSALKTNDSIFKKIDSITLKENIINNLLIEKLEKYRNNFALVKDIGTEQFTNDSLKIFGAPDKTLVNQAYSILKNPSVNEESSIVSSKQAIEMTKKFLESLNLKKWKLIQKNMPANAAVIPSCNKIYLRKEHNFSLNFIKRILVHEIGAHIFRAANGARQPYILFKIGMPDYMMTEEGIAVNAEEMNECLNINTLRSYAGRVIANHLALEQGFRGVFEELKPHFREGLAWKLALRAKRGLRDTSKPGAYTKDHLYLKGYYEVKAFLDENPKKGLNTLYYGKIGLHHVPLLKHIPELKPPEYLPTENNFKKLLLSIDSDEFITNFK